MTHAIEETNIECVMCGIGFESHEKFVTHIQMVHERADSIDLSASSNSNIRKPQANGNAKEPVQLPRNLKCFVCDERYSNEYELDRHRLINHCKVPKSKYSFE